MRGGCVWNDKVLRAERGREKVRKMHGVCVCVSDKERCVEVCKDTKRVEMLTS